MSEEEQLDVDTKKAIKSSKQSLKIQQQIGDSSEGAGFTPEVLDESTGKYTTSSEGAGIIPEVPDEAKGNSATKVNAKIDWGLEDDNHQSDEEYVNEGEITWLFTDDEEKANEDDDISIDIEETDDERTYSDNDDQVMDDAVKNDAEKAEEEKDVDKDPTRNEQAMKDQADDDVVGTLIIMSQKEKPEVPPSSSSRSLSSNYDVQIQQEIPYVLSASLLDVLFSVIPPQTTPTPTPLTTSIPIPPIISETPPVTIIHDPLPDVTQRLSDLENKFEAWTKVAHSEAIEASVQANVINKVKNQLPKVVKYLVKSRMESTVQNVLQKDPINLEQQESHKDAS
ncbi:hypothetical protein Tco_1165293 [Tanacetum coccineum]